MKIHNIKKTILNYILVIVFISVSCKTSGDEKQESNESFSEFRAEFYSDTIFQKNRVLFPVPGINTDRMEYNDTIYYWQKEKWLFLMDMSKIEGMKIVEGSTDTTIYEKMHRENSNFDVNVYYKLIDKKWYLVRLEVYNM
ncbi:MAG TPA: hypothetical protein DCG75_02695 [Bacteroidales bacterium]|nr:hypothetical protein [Bacteroidales bacterium]